jgi:glycosyltransferase involved in cell wall biosynthesis
MEGLAVCDVVIPISEFSAKCLREFWDGRGVEPTAIETVLLPGEFGGAQRIVEPKTLIPGTPVRFLSVSTLEPRKNHLALLETLQYLDRIAPEIDWHFSLVGNRYAGAETIALAVEAAAAADPRIDYLGVVDDEALHRLYSESTLTLYGSVIEGYGMPIVESLWHATPVLCHCSGVMAELAAGGGCIVADTRDPSACADALARLFRDPERYHRLSREATERPIRSWNHYTTELLGVLKQRAAASLAQIPAITSGLPQGDERPLADPTP